MDSSKLNRLRQIEIAKPCQEDWDKMDGDAATRFCAGCGCFVHNISAMKAEAAEQLLAEPQKVCARIKVDAKRGILTRDGWIPRLMLAGAMAATVAGCTDPSMALGTSMTSSIEPFSSSEEQGDVLGKIAATDPKPQSTKQNKDPNQFMGGITPSKEQVLLGKPSPPVKQKPKNTQTTKPKPQLFMGDISLVELQKQTKPSKQKTTKKSSRKKK